MITRGMEQEALLLICDVSGYTRYMLDNQEARRHGYLVIAELMQAVLKQTRSPLRVAKLEGDAVFLYALLPDEAQPGQQADDRQSAVIRHQVGRFFTCFKEKLAELVQSNVCGCGGCVNAGELRLKVVAHQGRVVSHNIGQFAELAGVDVILVHRLLKNSLIREEYLLLTDTARAMLWPYDNAPGEAHTEQYDDLGTVATFVLDHADLMDEPQAQSADYTALTYKVKNIVSRVFQTRLLSLGLKRMRPLTHNAASTDTP